MLRRNIKFTVFALVLVTILASCSLAYDPNGTINASAAANNEEFVSNDGSKTVLPGKYIRPKFYILEVKNQAGIKIRETPTEVEGSSVVFENIPMGTYTLTATGYLDKTSYQNDGPILGYGEDVVTVEANSNNSKTITVNPVSSSIIAENGTGTILIHLSWINAEIKTVKLVNANDEVIAEETIENPSTTRELTFNKAIPIGTNQRLRFTFYNANGEYIGETGPAVFNIYSGQESVSDEEEILYQNLNFELSKNITDYNVYGGKDAEALNTLKVSFKKPSAFTKIEFEYSENNEYKTIVKTAEDLAEYETGETVSFDITNLKNATEYNVTASMYIEDGKKSVPITRSATTAVAIDDNHPLTIAPSADSDVAGIAPGKTIQMVVDYHGATDFGGTWSTDNSGAISVDANGIVTGTDIGTGIVYYTPKVHTATPASYTVELSLNTPTLTATKNSGNITLNWTKVGVATQYDLYRDDVIVHTVEELTASNIDAATLTYVDTDITTGKEYTYKVIASYETGDKTYSSQPATITVEAISNPGITFEFVDGPLSIPVVMNQFNNIEVKRGESITFSVKGLPEKITSYQWSLNGHDIANATGTSVTIDYNTTPNINEGYDAARQSLMLVISDGKDYWSGTMYFYFVDVITDTIEFAEDAVRTDPATGKITVKAENKTENASLKKIVYTSSNPEIATVDRATGEVTAIANGEVTITASNLSGTVKDTIVVDSALPVRDINIINTQADNLLFIVDDREESIKQTTSTLSHTITSTAKYQDVEWKNDAPTVVTLGTDGTLTPLTAGTATITVTSEDNPNVTKSITVTVYELAIFEETDEKTYNNITNSSF